MDKLDLHEALRIYLPGLFVVLLLFRYGLTPKLEFTGIALVSVFLGLVINWPSGTLFHRYFIAKSHQSVFRVASCDAKDWFASWRMILASKFAIPGGSAHLVQRIDSLSDDEIGLIELNHYAPIFNTPTLYAFRLPKTLGYLAFVLAALSAAAAIAVAATVIAFQLAPSLSDEKVSVVGPSLVIEAAALALGSFLLLKSADYNINRSLKLELHYWVGLKREVVRPCIEACINRAPEAKGSAPASASR